MIFVPITPAHPDMDSLPGKAESDKIIMSDGGVVDNSPEAIHDYNEMRKRSAEAARKQYTQQQRAIETGKCCPFHPDALVCPNTPCKRDCALFVGNSCAFAARPGKVDTSGKPCPFKRRCTPSCALYNGAGCSLTNFATTAERI